MAQHRVEPNRDVDPEKGGRIFYHRNYDQKDRLLIVVTVSFSRPEL